ncbi:MAG: hypothetical protein O2904_04310 [bacterium]|nr:hypothetical protein [bacterium]
MIHSTPQRNGYIFLISVLVVGAIALAITVSMLLLSTSAIRTAQTTDHSAQAAAQAYACAEYGLMQLFLDISYAGDETRTVGEGACVILNVGGNGNENRSLCVEGMRGNVTRRMEIILERILPSIKIYSWQEVASISSCTY